MNNYKAGYIAVVGRPNVGKSTLINHILGTKLAITSRKPQTTRQNLLAIHTSEDAQFIFVDTPGLHLRAEKKMNKYMNQSAKQASEFVDLIIHISDATSWTEDDDYVLDLIKQTDKPVIHVINKMDLLNQKKDIIPKIDVISKKFEYNDIVPISALKKANVEHLLDTLKQYLPYNDKFFEDDQITTASMRFIASEIVREKLFKTLHQEIPYSAAVLVDSYKELDDRVEIFVTILLERASQKPIVIGKGGQVLKRIGMQARKELEEFLETKVELRTWVKIKSNWADNDKTLLQLGLKDTSI